MAAAAPYLAPILGSSPHLRCSACHDVLTGASKKPAARVQAICPNCAYVICGKCTAGKAHDRFCQRLAFAQTPRLLERVFAPLEFPEGKDTLPFGDCPLILFQVADYIRSSMLTLTGQQRQFLYERLRNEEALMAMIDERVGPTPPRGTKDKEDRRPTMGEAAFYARPMAHGAGDLGPSNADFLFASLIFAAQPNVDTLAQFANMWCALCFAIGVRAVAFSDPKSEARKDFVPEGLAHHRMPILEFNPYVSVEGQHRTETRGFPWGQGYCLWERIQMELDAHYGRKSYMNVAFYLHLMHASEDEANQLCLQGKYKGKRRDDESIQWPRRATCDFVLRIMGDPRAPQAAVYHSAAGLYSLDTWAKGEMHTSVVKRLADVKKGSRAEDFHSGLRFRPSGSTEAEWLACLLTHHVENAPPYAGSGERFLDKDDLKRFANDVDALLNPEGLAKVRNSAFARLTGIKWPDALSPFVLTLARADLTQ